MLNLNNAYQGYKGDPQLADGIKEYLATQLAQDLIPSPALPGDFGRCKQIQNKVYKLFLNSKFNVQLSDTVYKRIRKMFDPFAPEIQGSDLNLAFKLMRGLRGHDSIRVMKTWSHAWCTSDRFKEAVILPCLFGCSGAIDKQAHYIMCPFLFALQRFLWGPISEVSEDPLTRLALKDTCCNNVKLVACTFSAYHHVKFTYSARFHSGGDLDPSNVIPDEALALFYRSFAEVFKTEASELGLQTRSFDLATFDSYLNTPPERLSSLLAAPEPFPLQAVVNGQSAISVQSEG